VRARWATVAAAVLVAIAGVLGAYVGATTLAGPRATPDASLALASSPSPRPSRSLAPTTAADGLVAYPIGPIPADYRFVILGDPGDERVLLLDFVARQVRLVAHFEGFGSYRDARVIELTSTAAGDLLVIDLRADGPLSRLYFVRPATADVRTLTIPKAENPRLSPDASRLVVSRNSQDPDQHGLWLLNTSDGSGKRIVVDAGRRATRAIQWTADGSRMSALLDPLDFKRELVIVDVDGRITPSLGRATDARWRGDDLYFWANDLAGPVRAYNTSRGTRIAYEPAADVIVSRVEMKPRSTDLALRVSTQNTLPKIVLWNSSTGALTTTMDDAQWVVGLWWSVDALHLYAWIFDNDTTYVRDLFTNQIVLTFCYRAKIDPPCK
jgi:sulfur carrier protein ThiS